MRPVAPRVLGVDEIQCDGDQFKAITFAKDDVEDRLITRWTLTPEERLAIASGADVFVSLIGMLPPIEVHVGWPYAPLSDE